MLFNVLFIFLMEYGMAVVWEPSLNMFLNVFHHGVLNRRKKSWCISPPILYLSVEAHLNYSTALNDKLVAFMVLVSITSFQICIKFFLAVCVTYQRDAVVPFSWCGKVLNDLFPSHPSFLCTPLTRSVLTFLNLALNHAFCFKMSTLCFFLSVKRILLGTG